MNTSIASVRRLAIAFVFPLAVLGGCATSGNLDLHPVETQDGLTGATDLRLADSALAAGNLDLSGTLYGKVLRANPKSVRAELGLGDTYYQTGDLERAKLLYERAARQEPKQAGPQIGLARIALRQRRLQDAERIYRAVLAAQPNGPVASEGLGATLDLQGRHAEAQAVYRKAMQAHPESQGLRVDLGLSLILDHQPRAGANVLLDVAGLADAPMQARQNLALAYGLLGNADAAKRILSIDLPPSSVEDNLRFYQRLRKLEQGAKNANGSGTLASANMATSTAVANAAPLRTEPLK